MGNQHQYRLSAVCSGPRKGIVRAEGILPSLSFSSPPEFLGEAGHWTPEHFLVASLASCFVSTFSGIAERSRFDFASLDLEAEGVLSNEGGAWRFIEIKMWPSVLLLREADHERALCLLEKAEKSCLIARSLQCRITMQPTVKVEEELVAPAATETTCRRADGMTAAAHTENFFHGR